jgi:hypothetical protein
MVMERLICLINNFAALEVYVLELGTKVLVFRVEERVKDAIFDMEVRSRTLLRFHFRRTLRYPPILASAFSSLTINSSPNGPQIRTA